MRQMKNIIILSVLCLWLLACGNEVAHNPIIATVNGENITMNGFRAQCAFMGLGSDPVLLTQAMRIEVLEVIIERELLLQEALRLKIELTPQELDYHETMLRQDLEDNLFEKRLIEQGILYEQWREILRQEILSRKSLEMVISPRVHVSPEQVRAYFEEHKEDFDRPEQVLAQHALFLTRQDAQAVADLMRKDKDLVQAALEAKVVLDEETEPTWLRRGYVPESMEKTIFALEPGKVVGPIVSDYGFHVLRVLAKESAKEANLGDSAEEIQRILGEELKITLAVDLLRKLRSQAKVWTDERFMQSGRID